ncbi:MAG: hypothetical protein IK088_01865 [Lachnospiraceae bacterium]|nr:hypothetical protein [Lachnospiraceae bacterium]
MKKKLILLSFSLFVFFAVVTAVSFQAKADYPNVQRSDESDVYVYAPAVYDLVVFVANANNPTYQWYAGVGKNLPLNELLLLEDNEYYSGTKTNHLKCLTNDGLAEDSGDWDDIYFTCRVTNADGKEAWGPDMNMIVRTYADLLIRLEKEDIRFTASNVTLSGGTIRFDREENGVRYYTAAGDFASAGLVPSCRFSVLPAEIRTWSNAELVVETYITHAGKTFRYDGKSTGFSPTQYGRNAVTFRSDLVLCINGEQMETLDSVTSVITVEVPDPIGVALTKGPSAVLADQYSQAAVITRLEKDTRVMLLKDAGGYYRVAVNGYFGYIPKTALSVAQNIEQVSVTVQSPVDGTAADGAVTVDDPGLYMAETRWNQELWYDKTAGRFLKTGDRFTAGHQYRVTVWLTAKSGKRFQLSSRKPNVVGFINGMGAEVVTAYEQDPEEIIEVSMDFDHVHNLVKVNRVYPTCTAPGKELHYRCACGWRFEDYEAKTVITDEYWGIIPPLGHKASEWKSDGANHYRFCLRRECGEIVEGTPGAHTGGTPTCSSGAICTICHLAYGAKGNHIWSTNWDYKDAAGHAHMCTALCGTHGALSPHRPGKAATATEPQVCQDCGYVLKEASGETPESTKREEEDTEESSERETGQTSSEAPETDPSSDPGEDPSETDVSQDPGNTEAPTGVPSEGESGSQGDPGSGAAAYNTLILILFAVALLIIIAAVILILVLVLRKRKKS